MSPLLRRCAALGLAASALGPLLPACSDLEIHDVYLALDGSGLRKRTVFYTDTTAIYCNADYGSSRSDITMNAVIRQIKDANNNATDIVLAVGELAPGVSRGVLSWELSRPMPPPNQMSTQPMASMLPYPVGTFRCEVYVDGLDPANGAHSGKNAPPQGTAEFQIQYATCPVSYAAEGAACKGFFRDGQVCPGAETKPISVSCTCDGTTGAWMCK